MFTGLKQRFTQLIVLTVVFVSCNNAEAPKQEVVDTTAASNMEAAATSFPVSMVNNKKDPTCEMPVTAGISDTAHYKDKVIGFCSSGCKDEFKLAPDAKIAAAEIQ
jgi:YHS domain-containing protein